MGNYVSSWKNYLFSSNVMTEKLIKVKSWNIFPKTSFGTTLPNKKVIEEKTLKK